MPERLDRVDEIIERSWRGEATETEAEQLVAWRQQSLANERHYRHVVRILSAARELTGPVPDEGRRPTSAAIIAATERATDIRYARARHVAVFSSRWLPWSVAAAVLVAAIATWFVQSSRPARPWGASDIATGRSEMATLKLPDGSVVRLAPASRIVFGTNSDRREVTLDGRAFFSVARLPGRPFVVRTRHGDATVLGTRFELSSEGEDLRLVVVEGRVSLAASTNRVEVRGGETSGVRHGTAMAPRPVSDAAALERWVGKFLVFNDQLMSEVARDIEKMYGVRIVFGDSAVANRLVRATFTDRTVEDVLADVCTIIDARCVVRAGETVIHGQ